MSLLNSILDSYQAPRTTSAPRIVSEQHDTSKINYGGDDAVRNASGRRPSEPWDAAEYGMSLAEAQRKYDDAQTPEARERVIAELRERAIRRANPDVTDSRVSVMVAGEPAWHGLGVNVAEAVGWEQASHLSNTDWNVRKEMLYYDHSQPDGSLKQRIAGKHFALVREDSGKCLGVVGDRYAPIQNRDAFKFLDDVLAEHGARFETAGAIDGGKKIWAMVHMPKNAFAVNGNDKVEPYVLFTNSHGGEAAWCFPTSVRTVCANTFRVASQGRRKGICIRHVGSIRNKISAAQNALGIAVKQFNTFSAAAAQMAATKIQPKVYFGSVLDEILSLTEAEQAVQGGKGKDLLEAALRMDEVERELARKSLEKKLAKRGAIMEDLLSRYEEENQGKAGRGSAWAGFNACTEAMNHPKQNRYRGSTEERATRRFESIIDGDGDDFMQVAFRIATQIN